MFLLLSLLYSFIEISDKINNLVDELEKKHPAKYEELFNKAQETVNDIYPEVFSYKEDYLESLSDYLDTLKEKISTYTEPNNLTEYSDRILSIVKNTNDPKKSFKELSIYLRKIEDNERKFIEEASLTNSAEEYNQKKILIDVYLKITDDFLFILIYSNIQSQLYNPVNKKLFYLPSVYRQKKRDALNWSIFIDFLSKSENENITPDLYNEGVKILSDYVDLKIGVNFNDKPDFIPSSLVWSSNYDKQLKLDIFFKKLYEKIFIENHNNPLDLYQSIILPDNQCSVYYDRTNLFELNRYMDFVASVFDITYELGSSRSDYFVLDVYCKNTDDNFNLTISLKDNVRAACRHVSDKRYEIEIDKNDSPGVFLHEFTHAYQKFRKSIQGFMGEFYAMYMQVLHDQKDYYDCIIANTWNDFIQYTLIYNLIYNLNCHLNSNLKCDAEVIEDFKNIYKNTFPVYEHTFSKDYEKILQILEKNISCFYEKIINFLVLKSQRIRENNKIHYLIGDIFIAYCMEHEIKNYKDFIIESCSFIEMLKYLKITEEELADYAYNHFKEKLRKDCNFYLY